MSVPAPAIFGLDGWPEKAALSGIVVAITIAAFALINLATRRLATRVGATTDPGKWQQRRTAVTLLATMLRYLALVAAVAAILAIVAGGGSIGALGGSAVIAVTIGLASQRLLTDVIAGFFILFEGQYAVGDTIAVEPSKITGVVEELGVRTTLIREPDGSHSYVPNGQITAVRRLNAPNVTLVVSVLSRHADAATAAVQDLATLAAATHGVVGPLGSVETADVGDGLTQVRATIRVSAALTATATAHIAERLRAQSDEVFVGDPVVVAMAPASERPRTSSSG